VVFFSVDSLVGFSVDDPEPELLAVLDAASDPHSIAWSPDGQLIAFVNGGLAWLSSGDVNTSSIWIVDSHGGEPIRVTDEQHMNTSPQWLAGSRHMLFVSNRDGTRRVYSLEVGRDGAVGEPQGVSGPSDPHSISISQDGRKLAYSQFTVLQHIWSIPIPRSGSVSIRDAVRVTSGNQVIEHHSLSPDGEWIVFDSNRRGNMDIYKMPVEGGTPELAVDLPENVFVPDWSPNGTEITFIRWGGASGQVWVVSANGGTPRQLTDSVSWNIIPQWSPDGLQIAYGSGDAYVSTVSRDSVGGVWGAPVQLTDFRCAGLDWNPDGSSLLCFAVAEETGALEGIVQVSLSGEELSRIDLTVAGLTWYDYPQFSADGSVIYFVGLHEDGAEGVWSIPTTGGESTQLVAFDDPSLEQTHGFTVGNDRFYLTLSEYESDIWVMDLEW
jgi:Tol biopolymer transport system component